MFNAESSRSTVLLKTAGNDHANSSTKFYTAFYAVRKNDAKSSTDMLLCRTLCFIEEKKLSSVEFRIVFISVGKIAKLSSIEFMIEFILLRYKPWF